MRKPRYLFPLVLLLCLMAPMGGSVAGLADIAQAASERPCQCGDECYGCPHDINNDCVINISTDLTCTEIVP